MDTEAHQQNLDAAQREMDSRQAQGEDMNNMVINQTTYAIEPGPAPEPSLAPSYVIAMGNAFDGHTLYGPFNDTTEAQEWAYSHSHDGEWRMVPVLSPIIKLPAYQDGGMFFENDTGDVIVNYTEVRSLKDAFLARSRFLAEFGSRYELGE